MLALTVTQPFAEYGVGQTITDKDAIKDALATNPASVVRVSVEDAPKTPPKKSDGSA